MTVEKFANPTHVAGCTRFVCCSDMITVRTIGYHENAPKITSIGSRKANVARPSFVTQENGPRRAFSRNASAAGRRANGSCVFSTVEITGSTVAIRPSPNPTTPASEPRSGRPERGCSAELPLLRSLRDCALRGLVRLLEHALDVRVLIRQHSLDDRIERVIDAL